MYAMIPAEALLVRFTVAAALFLDLSESLVGRGGFARFFLSFFFLLMFLGLVFSFGFLVLVFLVMGPGLSFDFFLGER